MIYYVVVDDDHFAILNDISLPHVVIVPSKLLAIFLLSLEQAGTPSTKLEATRSLVSTA